MRDISQHSARESKVSLRTPIVTAFLAVSLLSAMSVADAQGILSTFPAASDSTSFYIGTDSAANYEGGAVAFTPQQDYTLTSATVELSGYNGAYGQLASLSIFSDLSEPYNPVLPDQPGEMLATGTVAPNDGSQAAFTVEFPEGLNLSANTMYWLFVQDTSPNGWEAPNGFSWDTGGDPTGAVTYDGSEAFIVSGFTPIVDPPAFALDATTTAVPEPSGDKLICMTVLIGLTVSSWRRFKCKNELRSTGV